MPCKIASSVCLLLVFGIIFSKVLADDLSLAQDQLEGHKEYSNLSIGQGAIDSDHAVNNEGLQKYAGVFGGEYSQDLSPIDTPLQEHVRVKRFSEK